MNEDNITYEKVEEKLLKSLDEYYEAHFQGNSDEIDEFIQKQYKKLGNLCMKAYLRAFILEDSITRLQTKSTIQENILIKMKLICNLYNYIVGND